MTSSLQINYGNKLQSSQSRKYSHPWVWGSGWQEKPLEVADFSPVLFRIGNVTRDRKGVCEAPGEPYFLLFLAHTMESGRRDCVGSGGGVCVVVGPGG